MDYTTIHQKNGEQEIMSTEKWHMPIWEGNYAVEQEKGLQAFKLKGTTQNQEQALRSLAKQVGFENMRGFNKWMESADMTYYDLIKIASPS